MNEIHTFKFDFKANRCYIVNDEPWFYNQSVATSLEYNGTKKGIANIVDDAEKRTWKI